MKTTIIPTNCINQESIVEIKLIIQREIILGILIEDIKIKNTTKEIHLTYWEYF
jgi:hypothetical protein